MTCDARKYCPPSSQLCEQLGGIEFIVRQISSSKEIVQNRPLCDDQHRVKIWNAALGLALGCKDDQSLRRELLKPNLFRMLMDVVGNKNIDGLVRLCSIWSVAIFFTEYNELCGNGLSHFCELIAENKVIYKLCCLLAELSSRKYKANVNWTYFALLSERHDEDCSTLPALQDDLSEERKLMLIIGKSLVSIHHKLDAYQVPALHEVSMENSRLSVATVLRSFGYMLRNKAMELRDFLYLVEALFQGYHLLGSNNSSYLRMALSETGAIDVVGHVVLSCFEGSAESMSIVQGCFRILDFALTLEYELCSQENEHTMFEHFPIFRALVQLRFFDNVAVLVLSSCKNIDQEDPYKYCNRLVLQMLAMSIKCFKKGQFKNGDQSLACSQFLRTKTGKKIQHNTNGKKESRKPKSRISAIRNQVKMARQVGQESRNLSSKEVVYTSVLSKSLPEFWDFLCDHGLFVGICYSLTYADERVRNYTALVLKEIICCACEDIKECGQNRSRVHPSVRRSNRRNVIKTFVELGCIVQLHCCRSNAKSNIPILSSNITYFVDDLISNVSLAMVMKSPKHRGYNEGVRYKLNNCGEEIMATLKVHCSKDLICRICSSLVILSLYNDNLKCILADHKCFSASISRMVATGDNVEGVTKIFDAVSTAFLDTNIDSEKGIGLSSINVPIMPLKEDSSIVTFLHCGDMQGKVRFECPPINELRFAAPKLAFQIEEQCRSAPNDPPNIHMPSYEAAEEFMGHISMIEDVQGIFKYCKSYSLDLCLALLTIARDYAGLHLSNVYESLCFQRLTQSNIIFLFSTSLSLRCIPESDLISRFSIDLFRRIASDFKSIVSCSDLASSSDDLGIAVSAFVSRVLSDTQNIYVTNTYK